MRYIQKKRTGIGYNKLLKIHKAKGCYDDIKNCQVATHCDSSRSKYQNKRPLLHFSPLSQMDMNC
ncbi:MAG: hypothetical protein KU28_09405, partial [Sulfurovum sp. PC08-66]